MSILSKMDDFAKVVGTAIRDTNLHMDELLEAIADIDNKYATTVDYVVSTPNIDVGDIVAGVTYTLASSAESLLANDPLDVTFFILSIPELNIVNQAFPATENAFSTTVTIPEGFNKPSIKISLYALDSENHKSETNIKVCPLVEAEVKAPIITSPEEGALLKLNKGIVVTTSAFNATVQDTHDTSSFKVTSDALGRNVILNDANVTDLTAHTFPLYSFDDETFAPDTDYFIHAQHHGALLGNSKWSLPRKFRVQDGIVTKNGRFIYRHPSDRGIVIEWELNGAPKKLFVYDEVVKDTPMLKNANNVTYSSLLCCATAYRPTGSGGRAIYSIRSFLGNYEYASSQENGNLDEIVASRVSSKIYYNYGEIAGFSSGTDLINNGSDNTIDSKKGTLSDSNFPTSSSAKANVNIIPYTYSSRTLCNFWETLNSANEAVLVNYARSITDIEGIDNLDIPSLRELLVILTEINNTNPDFIKRDLHSIFVDHTINDYGKYCLTSNTTEHFTSGSSSPQNNRLATMVCNQAAYARFLPGTEQIAYNTASNVFSFLVRDLTDYTEEQTEE